MDSVATVRARAASTRLILFMGCERTSPNWVTCSVPAPLMAGNGRFIGPVSGEGAEAARETGGKGEASWRT